jgi:hypothetical protein
MTPSPARVLKHALARGLGELVGDEKDADPPEDADEDLAHPRVVVRAQRPAEHRLAVEEERLAEHEHEWERDAEGSDRGPDEQVGADVRIAPRRCRARLDVDVGPQEPAHCYF